MKTLTCPDCGSLPIDNPKNGTMTCPKSDCPTANFTAVGENLETRIFIWNHFVQSDSKLILVNGSWVTTQR